MNLLAKLQDDMKTAMKAGDKDRLSVIRMLISDVKIIDLQPTKPTEEQAVAAYGKKLRKGMEEYEKLGKADQVAKLKAELAIVESYLPKKASAEETERLVDEFLAKNTFTEKQIGPAMGAFMKAHGLQVEAAIVNPMLRKKLAGK
ncbi:MAG: GatB/YqeY domain-containing protein [Planctomycetota bacterium]|nr:GatB/YqeY domain-containing protein [Planctomycetota bacterium]